MDNQDIADALWSAYLLVISRDSDVWTENGYASTVDTSVIIELESKLSALFETGFDDVTNRDAFKIREKLMEFAK